MLGTLRKSAGHLEAVDRVQEATRRRLKLPQEAAILVSEIACALPGCPPLETVVAFWTLDGKRHHFKIFKPVAEIVEDDLPVFWLMRTLVVPDGFIDDCC